ncbi:hypothetical protein KY49_6989 [Burkholderia sp. MSHR3999]|nr:hypothetical protein KY49_6989 [Burkholderia sp. MSHR3999]
MCGVLDVVFGEDQCRVSINHAAYHNDPLHDDPQTRTVFSSSGPDAGRSQTCIP